MPSERDFAAACLRRLRTGQTTGIYPYVLVGGEIIPPDELISLSDSELRARWQGQALSRIWSCRNYAQFSRNSDEYKVLAPFAYPNSVSRDYKQPIVLFMPPRWEGDPPRYVAHWGDNDEAFTAAIELLLTRPLPIDPRQMVDLYHEGYNDPPIKPILLEVNRYE